MFVSRGVSVPSMPGHDEVVVVVPDIFALLASFCLGMVLFLSISEDQA